MDGSRTLKKAIILTEFMDITSDRRIRSKFCHANTAGSLTRADARKAFAKARGSRHGKAPGLRPGLVDGKRRPLRHMPKPSRLSRSIPLSPFGCGQSAFHFGAGRRFRAIRSR